MDTNILIYGHRSASPEHPAATKVLRRLAEGDVPWAIPVFCLTEFVRVVTHPRSPAPSGLAQAVDYLEEILKSPTLRVLNPGPRFFRLFGEALEEGKAAGNLAFDAQIVAVCREAGVRELLSNDRDFARFGDFATRPLARR